MEEGGREVIYGTGMGEVVRLCACVRARLVVGGRGR